MAALRSAIGIVWVLFWIGWVTAALTAKRGRGGGRGTVLRVFVVLIIIGGRLAIGNHDLLVRNWPVMIVGTGILLAGLGLAVWARICMGRNWGMPMTLKDEPELVTTGPYRSIRHPIYTGVLLGLVGTALATSMLVLLAAAAVGVYFVWSARSEEHYLTQAMPDAYPAYMRRTKMLIPFLY